MEATGSPRTDWTPERGELLGEDGDPIVQLRPVVRIGIDKSEVGAGALDSSARRLARLVKIDPKAYAAKVAAAGPQAFVEAIVFRATDPARPPNKAVFAIDGALPIEDDQMLAPTRDFARPIIGSVGEATKEIVDASDGTVVDGDQVGLSGLQQRYDTSLRGTPGVRVELVAAKPSGATASPTPSPSPSPSAAAKPVMVFEVKPVGGKPLTTTLNIGLQTLAEKTLAKTRPASALVAIRPSTGAVVAAANNAGTRGQSIATVGHAPPGSTFKVVTSLALLRAGLDPNSSVSCPRTVTVEGKTFRNYSDYPSGALGQIPLQTALAQSCNTAFIGQRGKIKGSALADAAGSLGVGIDYDTGFPSFFGSVPDDPSATGRAASLIGQGKVEASPLAMAGVVASVTAGRTVVPHLIEGQAPKSKGKPLTADEAGQLRQMMRAVVTEGSGRVLSGLGGTVIAKTGTAEYGTKTPLRTHAWMIAGQGRSRRRRLRQRRRVRFADRGSTAPRLPHRGRPKVASHPRSSPSTRPAASSSARAARQTGTLTPAASAMSPTDARRRAGTASNTASWDSLSASVARCGPRAIGKVSCPASEISSITSAALVTSTA